MGLIIDTGVFIVWERKGRAIDFSPWQDYGDAAISVMTASELLVGVHRADGETRRRNRGGGNRIGAHDLIIAATAKHHDSAVLTTNASDFARVPDLEVIELKT